MRFAYLYTPFTYAYFMFQLYRFMINIQLLRDTFIRWKIQLVYVTSLDWSMLSLKSQKSTFSTQLPHI